MKKTLVIGVCLVTLVSLVVTVCAIQTEKDIEGYGTIGGEYVKITTKFSKGWNLIAGLPSEEWVSGGGIIPNNIKAIYGFGPIHKDYIRFYPLLETEELNDLAISSLIDSGAFWVFIDSEGNGEFEYWTLEPSPLNQRQLFTGWNFVGISSEMVNIGESSSQDFELKDIVGNCNVEKSYIFDSNNQKWHDFPLHEEFDENFIGMGWVIKVSNNCVLGKKVDEINPPTLP